MNRTAISFFIFFIYCMGFLIAQTEIIILSDNVGTEIDLHENRFYRIFPKEKNLINAQIVKIKPNEYRISIVKNINGNEKKVRRYINQAEIDALMLHIDSQPEFTEEARIKMYEGMDFLRVKKILNDIPKPQYVKIGHSRGKLVKGTLVKLENEILHIQTANVVEKINLNVLDKLSYRENISDLDYIRPYTYIFTSLSGFIMARLYNSQRPATYNEYGIPRNDIGAYRQIFGIVIGLIFSGEVFDAVRTLLTPKDTIILSEAEYEKENY